MHIIDGKKLAVQKRAALKERIDAAGIVPSLAVVLVGNDPASHVYLTLKQKAAKEVGVDVHTYLLDADASAQKVHEVIAFLNQDTDVDGILVQLPLPAHLDADAIVAAVDPAKDVDGFHPVNRAKFFADDASGVYPVFPGAIMALIDACTQELSGKRAVVLGKSDVFDDVMTHALTRRGCDAQFICCTCKEHFTLEEERAIAAADIIVTAIGIPEMVCGDVIKDGAIVIDGGISKIGESTVGDVASYTCAQRDIFLSPVPGGVGPMTIACLLENVTHIAQKKK